MKVLMWGRFDLNNSPGGDKFQIEHTANELRKLGVEVDISTELSTDPTPYDIVHVFQLDWMPETNFYARKAKKYNKPLILSPIHHSVSEVKRFDDEFAFGFRRITKFLCKKQHSRDTFKNIFRSIFNSKKRWPTIVSIFRGLKNMHKETLSLADVVLVQTELEAQDLKETYGVDINWVKVVNGVSDLFKQNRDLPNVVGTEDYVLCVGRIEARKNQLSVIKAMEEFLLEEEIDVPLVFVGAKSLHHGEYVKIFDKEVAKHNWIVYVPFTPYADMPAVYKHAKVVVSASWFETTGLTLLEGLFMGANVVGAGERVKEYLGDMGSYCDPGDITSIKNAIADAYSKSPPEVPEEMKKSYTWANAAKQTLEVYKDFVK